MKLINTALLFLYTNNSDKKMYRIYYLVIIFCDFKTYLSRLFSGIGSEDVHFPEFAGKTEKKLKHRSILTFFSQELLKVLS